MHGVVHENGARYMGGGCTVYCACGARDGCSRLCDGTHEGIVARECVDECDEISITA